MIPDDLNSPKKIQLTLETLALDQTLRLAKNVAARAKVLRFIGRVEQLAQLHRRDQRWGKFLPAITQQSQSLGQSLQKIDDQFFHQLRLDIRAGSMGPGYLRRLLDQYTAYQSGTSFSAGMACPEHGGFDDLDYVVARLTGTEQVPQATYRLHREMVAYEPAPASVVLNLIDCVGFEPGESLL